MVDKTDVVYLKSLNSGRGQLPSVTQVVSATPNNLFDEISATQLAAGRTEYRCVYIKNENDTDTMKEVNVWMQSDNPNSVEATAQWAFDPITGGFDGGMAVLFDGEFPDIGCGNHADLWSLGLTKFSFILWIFPTAGGDGSDRLVLSHGGTSIHGIRLIIDGANSTKIRFQIKNSGATNIFAESTGLKLNQWNQIICVYDNSLGSANLKIYVDSVLGSVTGNLTETINLSATMFLGEQGFQFQGYMSGFTWFKTKALSQADAIRSFETDYLAEKEDPDYGLYMDEGTGSTLNDFVGPKTASMNSTEWADAFRIPNDTTAPPVEQWYDVTNGPISDSPNIGEIRPNLSTPIWIKWTVAPGGQDAKNDYCVIVVEGKITEDAAAPTTPNQGETDPPVVPAPVPNYTYAHAGDWDSNSITDDVVSLIKSWSPKVVCSVGDCAYDCGENDFFDTIRPIDDNAGSGRPRFETAFGNHDNDESECDDNEDDLKSHFKYNNTWHRFAYENTEFIFIDNSGATNFAKGSSQYNAVKGWLEAASKNSKIYWKVIVCHVAPWGPDSKHDYNEEDFTEIYQPLFDAHKVDLILAGHNHIWGQCEPAKYNSSSPTSPKVTQNGAGPYTKGNGTVVVINGTGGHDGPSDLYSAGSTSFTNYANNDHNGAGRIDISNSGKTLTYKFVDIDGGTEKTFVING